LDAGAGIDDWGEAERSFAKVWASAFIFVEQHPRFVVAGAFDRDALGVAYDCGGDVGQRLAGGGQFFGVHGFGAPEVL
jgi:hypothetical protein